MASRLGRRGSDRRDQLGRGDRLRDRDGGGWLAQCWFWWLLRAAGGGALDQAEAKKVLAVTEDRRNGARWSVALACGLRQGEALGLRWKYVNLDTGDVRVWWQLQRNRWTHGCADPHACGKRLHRKLCAKNCKQHRNPKRCVRMAKGHPKPCPAGCVGHARSCPQRQGGGMVFP